MENPKRKLAVLLIAFNRPKETLVTFNAIQKYQPKKIYIAIDGPRNNKDVLKIDEIKKDILANKGITDIEFNCRKKNLGCKFGVKSAIDWFFEREEKGIIIEDDCVADTSFFIYCEKALNHFEHTDIFVISGNNFIKTNISDDISFIKTRYPLIWGWATWKDKWQKFSFEITSNDFSLIKNQFASYSELQYWKNKFYELKYLSDNINTWDYYWTFSIWFNKGVNIIPPINLVENIGFGDDATHYSSSSTNILQVTASSFEIKDFKVKELDASLDDKIFKKSFAKGRIFRLTPFYRLIVRLKHLFK